MEKKNKVLLTNEGLRSKFKNNFDLVNYSIQLAENMIKSGRDARVKSDIQNRAMLILEEIREGKDQFDEIKGATSSQTEELGSLETHHKLIYQERLDRKKHPAAEMYRGEE